MPSISIRDSLNVEIVSANPDFTQGWGKYLRATVARLRAGEGVSLELRKPLHLAESGETGLGLTWEDDFPLGRDTTTLSVAAGARATIGVFNRAGMELLENTFVGIPAKVPKGSAFVSFSLHPHVDIGVTREVGALTFGFTAGAESELRCYRPFDLSAPPITVAEACKEVLEQFLIPNSADDIRQMRDLPTGTLACVTGQGRLEIGATVNVAAAMNPLASVSTLPKLGPLEAGGVVNASVGVAASIFGEFQIRVRRMDAARVHLSYHKMAGRSLDVSLSASAGVSLTLGGRDLLKLLLRGPGGLSEGSEEDLVKAGITDEQLDRVKAAMERALSRKLELAINAEFAALKQNDAAFLYEIDLDTLDAEGAAALDRAFAGDLKALNGLESAGGHGIQVLQSRTKSLRERTLKWRINLVGLVNILSVIDLIREGDILRDEESGDLVITDKVTRDHVGAITNRKQLRRLLYESMLMTLTYKASGLDVNTALHAEQSFFFFDKDANRQRLSDYLDAVAALGLIKTGANRSLLGSEDDFDASSLLLETTFEQAACERAFGGRNGAGSVVFTPPDQAFYEAIGRRALLALVRPRDPDAYRRAAVEDDELWTRMRAAGQPNLRLVLPSPITGGSRDRQALRVAVVTADYSVIVWWAAAMAEAAKRIAEMRLFLDGRTASAALDQDPRFRELRERLEKSVVKAISSNRSTFDDPWGLVALFMAAEGTAAATAAVVSPKFSLFRPE